MLCLSGFELYFRWVPLFYTRRSSADITEDSDKLFSKQML